MQEELLRVVDALDLSSASDADLEAKTHSSKDAQSAATVRVGARITEVEVGLLRKAGSCGAGGGAGTALMDVRISNTSASFELRGPQARFELRSGAIRVFDRVTQSSAFPCVCGQIEAPDAGDEVTTVAVTTDTREGAPQVAIDARLPAVYVVYSGALLAHLAAAFAPDLSEAESDSLVPIRHIAVEQAASLERRTASQLVEALAGRTLLRLDLRLAAPLIVVPRDPADSTTPFLAVELGALSCSSQMVPDVAAVSGGSAAFDKLSIDLRDARMAMCASLAAIGVGDAPGRASASGRISQADVQRIFGALRDQLLRPASASVVLEQHVLKSAAIAEPKLRLSGTVGRIDMDFGQGLIFQAIDTLSAAMEALSIEPSHARRPTAAPAQGLARVVPALALDMAARSGLLTAADIALAESNLGLTGNGNGGTPPLDTSESGDEYLSCSGSSSGIESDADADAAARERLRQEAEVLRRRPAVAISLQVEGLTALLSGSADTASSLTSNATETYVPILALSIGEFGVEASTSPAATELAARLSSVRLADLLTPRWTHADVNSCLDDGIHPAAACGVALLESHVDPSAASLAALQVRIANDGRQRCEWGHGACANVTMGGVEANVRLTTIGAVLRVAEAISQRVAATAAAAEQVRADGFSASAARAPSASATALVPVTASEALDIDAWRISFMSGTFGLTLVTGAGDVGSFALSGMSAGAHQRGGTTQLDVSMASLRIEDGSSEAETWRTLVAPIAGTGAANEEEALATLSLTLLGDEPAKRRAGSDMDCIVDFALHGMRVVYLHRFVLDLTAYFLDPRFWAYLSPSALEPAAQAVAEATAVAAKAVSPAVFKAQVGVRVESPLVALPRDTRSPMALAGRAERITVETRPDGRGGMRVGFSITGMGLKALNVSGGCEGAGAEWWADTGGAAVVESCDLEGSVGINWENMAERRQEAAPQGVALPPTPIEIDIRAETLALTATDEAYDVLLIVAEMNFTESSQVWRYLLESDLSPPAAAAAPVAGAPSNTAPQPPSETGGAEAAAEGETDQVLSYHVAVHVGALRLRMQHEDVLLCELVGEGLVVHVGEGAVERVVLVELARASGRRAHAQDVRSTVAMLECPSPFAAPGGADLAHERALFALLEAGASRSKMQILIAPVTFRLDPMVVLALSNWAAPPTRVRRPNLSFTSDLSVSVAGLTLVAEDGGVSGASLCCRSVLALNYGTCTSLAELNVEVMELEAFIEQPGEAAADITVLRKTGASIRSKMKTDSMQLVFDVELQAVYVSVSFASILLALDAGEVARKAASAQVIESIVAAKARRQVFVGGGPSDSNADLLDLPKVGVVGAGEAPAQQSKVLPASTTVTVSTDGIKLVLVDDSRGHAMPLLGLAFEAATSTLTEQAKPLLSATMTASRSLVATTGVASVWLLNAAQALWEPVLEPVALTFTAQQDIIAQGAGSGLAASMSKAAGAGDAWVAVGADADLDEERASMHTSLSLSTEELDVNLYQPALSAIQRTASSWAHEYELRRRVAADTNDAAARLPPRHAPTAFASGTVQNYAGATIRIHASRTSSPQAVVIPPLASREVPLESLLTSGFGRNYSPADALNAAVSQIVDVQIDGFRPCRRVQCRLAGVTQLTLLPAEGDGAAAAPAQAWLSTRVHAGRLVMVVLSKLCVFNTCAYPCRVLLERVVTGSAGSWQDLRRAALLRRVSSQREGRAAAAARAGSKQQESETDRPDSASSSSLAKYRAVGLPPDEALVQWFSCGEDLGRVRLAQGVLHVTRSFVCFSSYLPNVKPRAIPALMVSDVACSGTSLFAPTAMRIKCFDQEELRLRNFQSAAVRDEAAAAVRACRARAAADEQASWEAASAANAQAVPPEDVRALTDLGILKPGEALAVPPQLVEHVRMHIRPGPGTQYALNDAGISSAEMGLDSVTEETLFADAIGVDLTLDEARRQLELAADEHVLAVGPAKPLASSDHRRFALRRAATRRGTTPPGVPHFPRRGNDAPPCRAHSASPRLAAAAESATAARPRPGGTFVVTNRAFYFLPTDAAGALAPCGHHDACRVPLVDLHDVRCEPLEASQGGEAQDSGQSLARGASRMLRRLRSTSSAARAILTPEPSANVLVLGVRSAAPHPGVRFVVDTATSSDVAKLIRWLLTGVEEHTATLLARMRGRGERGMSPVRHLHNCRLGPDAAAEGDAGSGKEALLDVVHIESVTLDSSALPPPFGHATFSSPLALERRCGTPATVVLCAPLVVENLLPVALTVEVRCGTAARTVLERRRLAAGELLRSHATPTQSDTYISVEIEGFGPSQAVIARPSIVSMARGVRQPASSVTLFESARPAVPNTGGLATAGRMRGGSGGGVARAAGAVVDGTARAVGTLAAGVAQTLNIEPSHLAPRNFTMRLVRRETWLGGSRNALALAAPAWVRNGTSVPLWFALTALTSEEDLVGIGRPVPLAGMHVPLPPGGVAPASLDARQSGTAASTSEARSMRLAALAIRCDGQPHQWSAWQRLYPSDAGDEAADADISEVLLQVFNTLEKPASARHPWPMIAHPFAFSLASGPGGAVLVTVSAGSVVRNAVGGGVTIEVRPRGMGAAKALSLAPGAARALVWDATVPPHARQLEVRIAAVAHPAYRGCFVSEWSPAAVDAMRPDTSVLLKLRPLGFRGATVTTSGNVNLLSPTVTLRAGAVTLPSGSVAVVVTEAPTLPYAVINRLRLGRRLVIRQACLPAEVVPWEPVAAWCTAMYSLDAPAAGSVVEVAAEVLPDIDADAMVAIGDARASAAIAGTLGDGLYGRIYRVDLHALGRRPDVLDVLPRRGARAPHPDAELARFDLPPHERLVEGFRVTWVRPDVGGVRGTLLLTRNIALFDGGAKGPRDAWPLTDVASVRSHARRAGGTGEVRVAMRGGGRTRTYAAVRNASSCARLLRNLAADAHEDAHGARITELRRYSDQRYHCKVAMRSGGVRAVTLATNAGALESESAADGTDSPTSQPGAAGPEVAGNSNTSRQAERAVLAAPRPLAPTVRAARTLSRSVGLTVFLRGVGVSLVGRTGVEIAYLRLTAVRASWRHSPEAAMLSIEAAAAQLDNQLLLTRRPVIAAAAGTGGAPALSARLALEGVMPGERLARDSFESIELRLQAPLSIAMDVGEILPQLSAYAAALVTEATEDTDGGAGEAGEGGVVVRALDFKAGTFHQWVGFERPTAASPEWWAPAERAVRQSAEGSSGGASNEAFVLIEELRVGGINIDRIAITAEHDGSDSKVISPFAVFPALSSATESGRGGRGARSNAARSRHGGNALAAPSNEGHVAEAAQQWHSTISVLQLIPTLRGSTRLPGLTLRQVLAPPSRVMAAIARHFGRYAVSRGAAMAARSLVGYGALEQALLTTPGEAAAMQRRSRPPRAAAPGGCLAPFSRSAADAQAALAAVQGGAFVAMGERYVTHAACVEVKGPGGRFYVVDATARAAGAVGAPIWLFVTTRRTLAVAAREGATSPRQLLWVIDHELIVRVEAGDSQAAAASPEPTCVVLHAHDGQTYQATCASAPLAVRVVRTVRMCAPVG